MSTSLDELIGVLSRWLAGHVDNVRLTEAASTADRAQLSADQSEALDELLAELAKQGPPRRGELGRAVRETLEALALG
jgi:hypothetical protein